MALPSITRGMISAHTTPQSLSRGEDYYHAGAVGPLIRRGPQIEAEVEGSSYLPYEVRLEFDAGGLTSTYCSCPYDWGGWCKHIVAVLLTLAEHPEAVEEREPLDSLLADLKRDTLLALLLELAAEQPGLIHSIERYVEMLQATVAPPERGARPRQTAIDPEPFRRQARHVLHSLDGMRTSEAYRHVSEVVEGVGQVVQQAWTFIEAGDGHNALAILEAVTDEYTRQWYYLDDSDGYAGEFFSELDPAWTEAVLTADLTQEERGEWVQKLQRWQAEVADYGIDIFYVALEALAQGWEYPPLRRALAGEITALGAWESEDTPWYADELAQARLNVLERQERYAEYLHLAEAEGQTARYVTMLVRLGRAPEAVTYGLQYLATTDEALALAQALQEHIELEEALRIAEHGLTLHGQKSRLATWLCDAAAGADRNELALRAAEIAFREQPGLATYLRLQELAGETWPAWRERLLSELRALPPTGNTAVIEVFLHDDLIDDAIAALGNYGSYSTVALVADAAIERRPDWVIRASRQQAEQIMDAGKARLYHHAVTWLARAKAAYEAAEREEEWRSYLTALLEEHGRKYKLVPLLKSLR